MELSAILCITLFVAFVSARSEPRLPRPDGCLFPRPDSTYNYFNISFLLHLYQLKMLRSQLMHSGLWPVDREVEVHNVSLCVEGTVCGHCWFCCLPLPVADPGFPVRGASTSWGGRWLPRRLLFTPPRSPMISTLEVNLFRDYKYSYKCLHCFWWEVF